MSELVLLHINKNITKIENLPNDLLNYNCSDNQITEIKNLPNSLQKFDCYGNQITKILLFK